MAKRSHSRRVPLRVLPIFKQLMELNLIKLPEPQRPNDVGKMDDRKYCHYHRKVHHPTPKCFVLKNIILYYIDRGVIDENTIAEVSSSHAPVVRDETASLSRSGTSSHEDDDPCELITLSTRLMSPCSPIKWKGD